MILIAAVLLIMSSAVKLMPNCGQMAGVLSALGWILTAAAWLFRLTVRDGMFSDLAAVGIRLWMSAVLATMFSVVFAAAFSAALKLWKNKGGER